MPTRAWKKHEKDIVILKKVQDISSADISEYVIAMQDIQKELSDIDFKAENYETRPPARMNRPLENLRKEETKEIQYYRMKTGLTQEAQPGRTSSK